MAATALQCTACTHPDRDAIDALIRTGATQAHVTKIYGFTRGIIRRHIVNGHVPPDPDAPSSRPRDEQPTDDPREVLRRAMRDLVAMDVSKLAGGAKIAHLDAVRRVAADLARTMPPAVPDAVTMEEVEGLYEFVTILADVIEPHPQIKRELHRRLTAAGLDEVLG